MALKTGNPRRSTVDPKLYSIYESPDKQGVDFFTEGKKLAKPLKDTEARFVKEKAEDQKAFDERNKSISEIDLSQDQTFNAISLKYSQDMAANNMSDFDKVKRGEMSRTDFKIRQSNRSQSIATWGSTVKDYNKSFEAAQKRMQDGESGLQEQANMKGMAGFGNMANVVLIDDPNSAFGLMIELTDEEKASGVYPSYKDNPSRYVSATQANARMNQKIDKVNVVEKSKQYSETLGTTIKAYVGDKSIRTEEDFLLRGGGNKLISDYAKAIIGEGNETASVLADNIGGYTFTTVKSEAGGKVIYQEIQENGNHIAILDEEQIQAAQEYTEGVLKAQLDIKETAKQTRGDTPTEAKGKKDDEIAQAYLTSIDELLTGDPQVANAGAQNLVDMLNKNKGKDDPEILSIQRSTNGDVVVRKSNGTQQFTFSDYESSEQFRKAVYETLTPADAIVYDSVDKVDLTTDINKSAAGGKGITKKIEWSDSPTIDGVQVDWKSKVKSLGGSLDTLGDNLSEIKEAFDGLLNTKGFLPKEFMEKNNSEVTFDGDVMSIVINGGEPVVVEGRIFAYDTEEVIQRIQNVIKNEVINANKGISSGELD